MLYTVSMYIFKTEI